MSVGQETARLGRTASPRRDWEWQTSAACRGEDLSTFFGRDGESRAERDIREAYAKDICDLCPVRQACLEEALRDAPQHGVWGGLTADERTAERRNVLRRKRRAA